MIVENDDVSWEIQEYQTHYQQCVQAGNSDYDLKYWAMADDIIRRQQIEIAALITTLNNLNTEQRNETS